MDDSGDGPFVEERALVGGLQAGDEGAIRFLARQMSRRFVFALEERFGSREDAEEVVSDAAIKIVNRISTFRAGRASTFWSWAWQIVFNAAIDRQRRGERRSLGQRVFLEEGPIELELALWVAAPTLVGEERVEPTASPQAAALQAALEELDERDRMILELSFIARWPDKDIGQELGVRPDNVRKYRHRAKGRLLRLLEDKPEFREWMDGAGLRSV